MLLKHPHRNLQGVRAWASLQESLCHGQQGCSHMGSIVSPNSSQDPTYATCGFPGSPLSTERSPTGAQAFVLSPWVPATISCLGGHPGRLCGCASPASSPELPRTALPCSHHSTQDPVLCPRVFWYCLCLSMPCGHSAGQSSMIQLLLSGGTTLFWQGILVTKKVQVRPQTWGGAGCYGRPI